MSQEINSVGGCGDDWSRSRRRLAVVLVLAVGLTTPVVLALNGDHKLVFFSLELVTKFLIFYPAIRANCRWFGPVVAHFRTQQKAVWLTFDDGPHAEDTPKLLALLKRHNARATFFVIGRQVEKHPEQAVHAGALYAMGLIDEASHVLMARYREEFDPEVMTSALALMPGSSPLTVWSSWRVTG